MTARAEGNVNILLVDDKVHNLVALEAVLGELNQNLVRAQSGREALRRLREEDFAVIILDVRMPGLDGLDTATLLRRLDRSKHTPIIFVSAMDTPPTQEFKFYEAGAVDYLEKPFRPEVLRSKVKVFVDLFLKTEQIRQQSERLRILELREQERKFSELEEVKRELDGFAYTVAHDLRSPLRAMSGFSEALLEEYADKLDLTGRDYATRILESARRMDSLIQDLLAYSRLSRGDIVLQAVDLGSILHEILTQMSPELKERRATVNLAEPLPRVTAHPVLLNQILTNLLSNAIKFMGPGVDPHVRVRAEGSADGVRVWVEDNGIGISAEHHERIFRVFERLHLQERYPGTGIGLAIVRRAVERLHGQAGVESELGKGSRFWISLKRVEDAHEINRLHHAVGRG
jgi:two-component system sensor histidine kinase/response regulator